MKTWQLVFFWGVKTYLANSYFCDLINRPVFRYLYQQGVNSRYFELTLTGLLRKVCVHWFLIGVTEKWVRNSRSKLGQVLLTKTFHNFTVHTIYYIFYWNSLNYGQFWVENLQAPPFPPNIHGHPHLHLCSCWLHLKCIPF